MIRMLLVLSQVSILTVRRFGHMEFQEATRGHIVIMQIGVNRTWICSQGARYLADFLHELTFAKFSSVQFQEDIVSARHLAGNAAFLTKTKHICTRYHFLRELVVANKIIVSHVGHRSN